jgi:Transglycosylase SLT domain
MEYILQCDGYHAYRWLSDGAIEVHGLGFPSYAPGSAPANQIVEFWDKYGSIMTKYARQMNLPVSWVVGITYIESGGNEWACAPCKSHTSSGAQWCSLAPDRCGGGVASDGKRYSCCAYGLMQVIDYNARRYGMDHGAQLLGNPDDSIRVGTSIFRDALAAGAQGDPIVASRMYNGCRGCGGGRAPCGGGGLFGVGGQGNYSEKFAKSVNTFLALDLAPKQEKQAGLRLSTVGGIALLGVAGIVAAGIWDRQRGQVPQ